MNRRPARLPGRPVLIAGLALLGALSAAAALAGTSWDGPAGKIRMVLDGIPQPLSAGTPDPARGREVFLDTERGHCLRCHRLATVDAPFQGNLGPDLTDVGARLEAAQLRLRLVDPSRLNPDTVMPPYYRVHGLHRVAEGYRGRPILDAREVEDLIAYLGTLDGAHD